MEFHVLDNKWSRDTIDKLIENYHIEYITTAVGKFKRTTSFGTFDKYISEQLKVDDLLHIGYTSGTTGLPKAYYRNEHSWIASYVENENLYITMKSSRCTRSTRTFVIVIYMYFRIIFR